MYLISHALWVWTTLSENQLFNWKCQFSKGPDSGAVAAFLWVQNQPHQVQSGERDVHGLLAPWRHPGLNKGGGKIKNKGRGRRERVTKRRSKLQLQVGSAIISIDNGEHRTKWFSWQFHRQHSLPATPLTPPGSLFVQELLSLVEWILLAF